MSSEYRKDIAATLLNQVFKVFAGPVLLVFIPLYLNPIEQGYWYTFMSIAALAIFADLGFSNIVLQFSAHEFAYLKFSEAGIIEGYQEHLNKLASFFRFSITWLLKVTLVVFPLIIIGGYIFLDSKHENIEWSGPWLIYSLFSAIVFMNSIILSFFEGCNSVKVIQLIRLKITAISTTINLFCLYMGLGLYSIAASLFTSALVGLFLIYNNYKKTILQLLEISRKDYYDWRKQFFSLIWRYAISWCSGYFIFQLFVPIAFKFHGPEFAGKIGISIAMWTAGFGIASSWITAITPKINMYISEKKWSELDRLFHTNLKKSMMTMIAGGAGFILFFYLFENHLALFKRILPIESMSILFICWICQLYINNWAIYLRGHKKEPLMLVSVFSAVYVCVSTLICGYLLPAPYIFMGFLSSYIYGIPVTMYIVRRERRLHSILGSVMNE